MDIQIATEDDDHPPPAEFEQWVASAIGNRMAEAQICIRIVDSTEITQLNSSYRAQSKPTNVLSFPADLPKHIDIPLLGDLVICSEVVNREAIEQNKIPQHHWAHMVVHGTLHLLGYDHVNDDDAELMERLEVEILQSLEISDPYSDPYNTIH